MRVVTACFFFFSFPFLWLASSILLACPDRLGMSIFLWIILVIDSFLRRLWTHAGRFKSGYNWFWGCCLVSLHSRVKGGILLGRKSFEGARELYLFLVGCPKILLSILTLMEASRSTLTCACGASLAVCPLTVHVGAQPLLPRYVPPPTPPFPAASLSLLLLSHEFPCACVIHGFLKCTHAQTWDTSPRALSFRPRPHLAARSPSPFVVDGISSYMPLLLLLFRY